MNRPAPADVTVAGTMPESSHGTVLVIVREFAAPRDLVFRAWTEPEHFVRWFGPHGSTVHDCTLEVRPGGRIHFRHTVPDLGDVWVAGEFLEVVAPERLVFTAHFSDPSGGVRTRPGFAGETRIAVLFEATAAGRTTVTIRQTGLTSDQGEGRGWQEGLERLGAHLARTISGTRS
ncbi:MAG TPA: SRPBCC domain-containing protein [Longimicrobiales bacterium]|nr:SRPBCC domain-containing protein [Longimicrobiales bacterium]